MRSLLVVCHPSLSYSGSLDRPEKEWEMKKSMV